MKKILVAEDDTFLANAYRVKLTKAGFEVRMAKNGSEALQLLGSYQPDLIILDLVMPVKDGFMVLEEMKASPVWKNIPVIIASNLGQKEDIDRGVHLGASDFIVKSNLSMNDLVAKVNAFIEKR